MKSVAIKKMSSMGSYISSYTKQKIDDTLEYTIILNYVENTKRARPSDSTTVYMSLLIFAHTMLEDGRYIKDLPEFDYVWNYITSLKKFIKGMGELELIKPVPRKEENNETD